jgi:hypothetical protein
LRQIGLWGHARGFLPTIILRFKHRVGRVLGFFSKSSELGLPHPLTHRRVCVYPPLVRGTHSRGGEGRGKVPIPTMGRTLWLYSTVCTLWFQGIPGGRLPAGAEVRGRPRPEQGGNSCETDGEAAVRGGRQPPAGHHRGVPPCESIFCGPDEGRGGREDD